MYHIGKRLFDLGISVEAGLKGNECEPTRVPMSGYESNS